MRGAGVRGVGGLRGKEGGEEMWDAKCGDVCVWVGVGGGGGRYVVGERGDVGGRGPRHHHIGRVMT